MNFLNLAPHCLFGYGKCPVLQRATLIIVTLVAQRAFAQPAGDESPPAGNGRISVSVHAGGIGRYGANRWGMIKAQLFNTGSVPRTTLVVVTPPGGEGLQYARKISVPGQSMFETSWPARIDAVTTGVQDFQYLVFPDGEEAGVIHQKEHQDLLPTISGMVEGSALGLTGWILDPQEEHQSMIETGGLIRSMRHSQRGNISVVSVVPQEITGHGEYLEPLDQLAISSSQLVHNRHACQSIDLWLQRGGRLLLFLDKTGPELAEVLLGDALPITVVGRASSNTVQLDLNPEYRHDQYPIRSVVREFDEPVHWLRILHESGDVIWSVDGWPVAIQVPIGEGTALVTTISPAAFIELAPKATTESPDFAMIASSRPMITAMFTPRTPSLMSEQSVAQQSAAVVGYQIPSRKTAAFLTLLFPALLLLVGVVLLRLQVGQRLVWILPVMAILCAIPSVVFGMRTRAVAPATLIETQLIRSVPGQQTLVADGYASFYSPGPSDMHVQTQHGTLLENRANATNLDYRRQVWTDMRTSHWENLRQPAGLTTFPMRSTRRLSAGLRAIATFEEEGLRGSLLSKDFAAPSDLILAGVSSDCMSLRVGDDGSFLATPDDVLVPGQYFSGLAISEQQKQRTAILRSVFSGTNRLHAFPQTSSILFWDIPEDSSLELSGTDVRHSHSVLVIQPLQLEPPEVGRLITIPSPLLPYRAIADADGGFSGVFNNSNRQWSALEGPGVTTLEFQIPSVCVPFDPESVQVSILIRAGSRTVKIASGGTQGLSPVAEFDSPLGEHQIDIPASLVRESCLAGRLLLQISVGDLAESLKSRDPSTGEQDDSWRIERIRMTLSGRRLTESERPAAAVVGQSQN